MAKQKNELTPDQVLLKEAMEVYPTWEDLHEAIKAGSWVVVDRYLFDSAHGARISNNEIVTMLENGELVKLLDKARLGKRKEDLHHKLREVVKFGA